MSLKIAVIGNTGMNIGAAIAGDMALAGHDVRFLLWPDQLECLEACRAAGGIHVGEPASKTISGKTGLAAIPVITDDPAEAIAGADLVVVNEVQLNLEARAADFIPHLENGQVLHVNMHGYWPGFRLAAMLREADKAGVTVTEGVTPTHAAARTGAHITPGFIRRALPLAAFPANRSETALDRLAAIKIRRALPERDRDEPREHEPADSSGDGVAQCRILRPGESKGRACQFLRDR